MYDTSTPEIQKAVKKYIRKMKKASKIDTKAKEELINLFNLTFNLNEKIDNIVEEANAAIDIISDIEKEDIKNYDLPSENEITI